MTVDKTRRSAIVGCTRPVLELAAPGELLRGKSHVHLFSIVVARPQRCVIPDAVLGAHQLATFLAAML